MLGAQQLKWFEDELLQAKARKAVWKVVVVSSPIQRLGTASEVGRDWDGPKSWAGSYACERNRVLKFIDDNAVDNVVFLTTDDHITIINSLKYNTVPEDPRSPLRPARNSFEILTGPIGAGTDNPLPGRVDLKGLSNREADRKLVAVWNGDTPDDKGQLKGRKQAGLDAIGLGPNFPGLIPDSIHSAGGKTGAIESMAFASFLTYTYAVVSFDRTLLSMSVRGIPFVPDPSVLAANAEAEREYESRDAEDILSFQLRAQ
jgi:hypothetical protein